MSNQEAIHPDVSEHDEQMTVSNARLDRLAEIGRNRRAETDKAGETDEDAADLMADRANSLNEALANFDGLVTHHFDDDPKPTPAPSPAETEPVYLKDGQHYARLKVNGQETEVPLSNLIATAQKHESADIRLQEAARRLREIEDRERAIAEREALITQTASAQPPAQGAAQDTGKPAQADRRDLVRQYHDALMEGDDERATDLYLQINDTGRPQMPTQAPVDPRQIEQAARAAAAAEIQQTMLRQAAARFQQEFSDVWNDESLRNQADALTIVISAERPELDAYGVMAEAGRRVRALKPQAPAQTLSDMRQARKSNLTTVTATSTRTQSQTTNEPPKTRSDVLDEIRASRGMRR